MDIIFNVLYKIDVAAKAIEKLAHTEEQAELESYIRDLLDLIVDEKVVEAMSLPVNTQKYVR